MGMHESINIDKFPIQGSHLGKTVDVCFHYDSQKTIRGEVVRDDITEPGRTIIKLEDGRYVLATECHYSIVTRS